MSHLAQHSPARRVKPWQPWQVMSFRTSSPLIKSVLAGSAFLTSSRHRSPRPGKPGRDGHCSSHLVNARPCKSLRVSPRQPRLHPAPPFPVPSNPATACVDGHSAPFRSTARPITPLRPRLPCHAPSRPVSARLDSRTVSRNVTPHPSQSIPALSAMLAEPRRISPPSPCLPCPGTPQQLYPVHALLAKSATSRHTYPVATVLVCPA